MLNNEKPVKLIIDKQKCTKCSTCINICGDYLVENNDGFPARNKNSQLGCIQCGHCMMKCPNEAIEIIGQDISKEHLRIIPKEIANYDSLNALYLKRRSHRSFRKPDVSQEDIKKILESAATSAIGIPPSEVKVIVIRGRKKVRELADDIIKQMQRAKILFNPFILNLIKPFINKTRHKTYKEFILPLLTTTIKEHANGKDILLYDAPVVMIFYSTELAEKEDAIISATQATISAEALNLGTCFIGSICPILETSTLRKKYGISKTDKLATAFILGHPQEKYLKGFQRNFKEIKIIN